MEPLGTDHLHVLHVALRPAAVADDEVDDRGRTVLVAALEVGGEPDPVAGAADKRRLDEVVAQDVAAEGGPARQVGETGIPCERLHPDHGVVAPVVRGVAVPEGETRRDDRAVDAGGELLEAAEQGVAADEAGHGLDEAEAGLGLHPPDEFDDRSPPHQAVGVEDDHLLVAAAPAAAEVGDVAGLAGVVAQAVAVVNAGREGGFAQALEGRLLGEPHLGVGRVGEEEEVEAVARLGAGKVLQDRPRRRRHLPGVLVVHGQQEGRARLGQVGPVQAGLLQEEVEEAEDRRDAVRHDPGHVDREQDEHRPFEQGHPADVEDAVHLAAEPRGEDGGPREDGKAVGEALQVDEGPRHGGFGPLSEGLHRHLDRILGRHRGRRRLLGARIHDEPERRGQAVHR